MTTSTTEEKATSSLVTVFYLPEKDRGLTKHSGTISALGATTFNYKWDENRRSYKGLTLNPYLNQDVNVEEWEEAKSNPIVKKYFNEEVLIEVPQKDYSFDNIMRTYSLPHAKQVIKLTANIAILSKWRLNTNNAQILEALDRQIADVERGRGII